MKHRNSHLLIGYWSRTRRGREVPDQSDIDPRAIKRMLSHVFIVEARDAANPVYRLAGTNLCDRFGQELRGVGFLSLWEARARDTLALLLRQSLAANLPVCLSSIGETAQCATIEMETVMAPLTFGHTAPQRFLGITQLLADSSHLGGAAIALQRLMGSKMIREGEPVHNDIGSHPPPFDSGRGSSRAPHLRLVVSRDTPTLHCDLDQTMRGAIEAFEFPPATSLVRWQR
ncbi:MAG TPA: PAS domain-containing protein [Rhizomicrobium sp.]|jgi:hypothetical protein|nr:PAS domain-containing protein [Rhizomicrobium sp.]